MFKKSKNCKDLIIYKIKNKILYGFCSLESFSSFYILSGSDVIHWLTFWVLNAIDLTDFNKKVFTIIREKKIFESIIFNCHKVCLVKKNYQNVISLYVLFLINTIIPNKYPIFVNKRNLYCYLRSFLVLSGETRNSYFSETDPRSSYCRDVLLSINNIMTPEIVKNNSIHREIVSLLTHFEYNNINGENHASFQYCKIVSLQIWSQVINKTFQKILIKNTYKCLYDFLDLGLAGRIGKVSDNCYFFWANAFSIIANEQLSDTYLHPLLINAELVGFGFSDKLGNTMDFYHTCYSVLSIAFIYYLKQFKPISNNNTSKISFIIYLLATSFKKINPLYSISEANLLKFMEKNLDPVDIY